MMQVIPSTPMKRHQGPHGNLVPATTPVTMVMTVVESSRAVRSRRRISPTPSMPTISSPASQSVPLPGADYAWPVAARVVIRTVHPSTNRRVAMPPKDHLQLGTYFMTWHMECLPHRGPARAPATHLHEEAAPSMRLRARPPAYLHSDAQPPPIVAVTLAAV